MANRTVADCTGIYGLKNNWVYLLWEGGDDALRMSRLPLGVFVGEGLSYSG